MSYRPVLLAAMLSMLLQAASITGFWSVTAAPGRTLQALLQWTPLVRTEDPDHEEPAAATRGDRDDSSADTRHHAGAEAWLHVLGLMPAQSRSIAAPAAGSPPELLAEAAHAEPVIEGLRRPPRPRG